MGLRAERKCAGGHPLSVEGKVVLERKTPPLYNRLLAGGRNRELRGKREGMDRKNGTHRKKEVVNASK